MDVFDLVAKITLDSSEYEQGIGNAESKASTFGQKLSGGLGKAAKIGAGAVAIIGTASAAAGAAFVKGAGDVAAYGDNIDKMSQKMGMSSDAYQEWDAVMRHSGTSMETMKASMKTLANAAETGSEAFDKLGISQQDIANMSQEELFEATITALQGVEDETERTYLAGKTLGRGATELGALLNTSAEDTAKMRKRVHELGGVMDKRGVKAAAKYQDSLQDMHTAMQGLSRNLMSDMLPSMTTVMDGITEIFAGDSDKGIGMVTKGIDSLVSQIGQKIPKILEIGGKLFTSFSAVLSENLPKVIEAAVSFVTANLPGAIKGLLTVALPALISLVGSVAKSLPSLLKGVWNAVKESVTEVLPTIKEHGGKILTSIVDGIKGAISKIPEAIGQILTSIGGWVSENGGSLLEKGKEILGKIISGIGEAIGNIGETLASLLTSIGTWVVQNYNTLAQKGKDILNYIVEGFIAVVTNIGKGITKLISSAVTWVTQNYSKIIAIGKTILGYVVEGVIAVVTKIGEGLAELLSTAGKWFTDKASDIQDFGKSIVDYIKTGISNNIKNIKDGFSNLVATIRTKIASVGESIMNLGKTIITKIKDGIKNNLEKIKSGFTGMVSKIKEKISGMSFSGAGKAIVDGIASAVGNLVGSLARSIRSVIEAAVRSATATKVNANVNIAAKTGYSKGSEDSALKQAKALHKPYLFNKATIFGRYQDKDLIAGEAGPEMLLGVNKLNAMLMTSVQGGMQAAMGSFYDMASSMQGNSGSERLQQEIINVLNTYLPQLASMQVVLDTGLVAGAVAPGVDENLGTSYGSKTRYSA